MLVEIRAWFDDDPDALIDEIAALRLAAALDAAQPLHKLKATEMRQIWALEKSEDFDDRLVATLFKQQRIARKARDARSSS